VERHTESVKTPLLTSARILYGVAGILIFLSLLEFPAYVAGPELDPSWAQALNVLHKSSLQSGVDFIFTYGPLGCFTTAAYDPDLIVQKFLWEVAIKGFMTLVLLVTVSRIQSVPQRIFFCALLILAPLFIEALYLLTVFLALRTVLLDEDAVMWKHAIVGVFLALVSATKFNLALYAVVSLVITCGALLLSGYRRKAAMLMGSFSTALAVLWVVNGQSLFNLPRYVQSSLELSSGYTEAMAVWLHRLGRKVQLYLAAGILMAIAIGAACSIYHSKQRVREMAVALILGAASFIMWKHGFVRHDGHEARFFTFMCLAPFVLAGGAEWRLGRSLLLYGTVLGSLAGFYPMDGSPLQDPHYIRTRFQYFTARADWLISPMKNAVRMDNELAARREQFALPKIRATVKDAGVDSLSDSQGILFLNELNWKPRPVMQSHATVTAALIEANADFYRSAKAPEFVITQFHPIDDRPISAEDPLALIEILARYKPVLIEREFLLLRRQPEAALAAPVLLLEKTMSQDEVLDLSAWRGKLLMAKIDLGYTAWGSLFKFVWKPPEVYLNATVAGDGTYSKRLIPSMVRSGFLLQPFLAMESDFVDHYRGSPGRMVQSLGLTYRKGWNSHYSAAYHISIYELPAENFSKLSPAENATLAAP